MSSMASAHGVSDGTERIGFRRKVRIVAPWKGSLTFALGVVTEPISDSAGGVIGGESGRRSFAAK